MKAADIAEYEDFVSATVQALRRAAYLMCGDWQRAEDATQDALVKVYVVWPRLRHRNGLRSYAHRAVATAVIDQSRRPWRREFSGETAPIADAVADHATGTERRMAVVAALQDLPPRRRACVVLRYFGDLSVADTAAALGVDPGTVKSQTARALDQLRGALASSGLDLAMEDL